MSSDEGYNTARQLLKSNYGQDYLISVAYAERLAKAPQIKDEDGQTLQQYSILLTSCKNTLKEIGYVNKLENPDMFRKIIDKLPFGLKQRWREVADNISEEKKREITIEDITEFIDRKARAANHPIFGNLTSHT